MSLKDDLKRMDQSKDGGPLALACGGGRLEAMTVRGAKAARASLIVCGHSHVPFIGRDRGVAVFNPGSIGPKRFALPIVFGVIEIDFVAFRGLGGFFRKNRSVSRAAATRLQGVAGRSPA